MDPTSFNQLWNEVEVSVKDLPLRRKAGPLLAFEASPEVNQFLEEVAATDDLHSLLGV